MRACRPLDYTSFQTVEQSTSVMYICYMYNLCGSSSSRNEWNHSMEHGMRANGCTYVRMRRSQGCTDVQYNEMWACVCMYKCNIPCMYTAAWTYENK